jgi:hypothetical protein
MPYTAYKISRQIEYVLTFLDALQPQEWVVIVVNSKSDRFTTLNRQSPAESRARYEYLIFIVIGDILRQVRAF